VKSHQQHRFMNNPICTWQCSDVKSFLLLAEEIIKATKLQFVHCNCSSVGIDAEDEHFHQTLTKSSIKTL
jgi:hypothetical protein